MAAKKFGLKCKIFMGSRDIERQRPNVEAIKKNGAEIIPVTTGSQTLVDAVSECMRYWVSNCDTTHMCVGSTVGPNIFIKICAFSTAQISRELIKQIKDESDTRKKNLFLDREGKIFFETAYNTQKKRIFNALKNSNADSVIKLKEVLKKIINEK